MDKTKPGIPAERPKVWKPKRVNLKGIFTELSKAVGKITGGTVVMAAATTAHNPFGVAGGWSTIISGIGDAVASLANVGTLTEGDRAYVLVERALAGAIAELVAEADISSLPTNQNARDIFEEAEEVAVNIILAPDFLQRPREIALVQDAQPLLHRWLTAHGMPTIQARMMAERLPMYFQLRLHEEMTQHSDYYAPLRNMLKLETAPLNLEEWNWQRYRAEIIREPHRPLFDEKFGLARIFVPLRANWYEIKREGREEQKVERSGSLEAELIDWALRGTREDSLRILSGDPGSGKTSCAKMWAAKMTEEAPGWRVVFVPLHRFGYKGDLRENLKTYLKEQARIEADLLDPHCPDPVLLFFDGLDELAMQGSSARQAAVAFVRHVIGMLSDQNRDRRRVLIVLGGRQLVVQECKEELRRLWQILHVQPYSMEERAVWWRKYGEATGNANKYTNLPQELNREDLESITVQPLLNYLLALSYERKKLDFSGNVTVNAIYADLLDRVYERVWGQGGNIHLRGTNKTLAQEEFQEILEEIGIAVWQSDSRSATRETIRARCEVAGLADALAKLEKDADEGVFRLLTAFHFRFKEGGEGSVEFTHKSFGEYLAARRICRLIKDITEERERQKKQRNRGWSTTDALVHWAKLCGPQPLDSSDLNLYVLLRNEVAALSQEDRAKSLVVFTELAEEMLSQSMPMEQCGLMTYGEMEQQAHNAEETLLCALYACLPPNASRIKREETTYMGPYYLSRWHFRRGVRVWNQGFACAAVLNYLGYSLPYANLTRADLRGAYLTGANLTGAYLTGAYLTGANLTEANLTGADLRVARGWKDAIGLNLEQVPVDGRPEGWEEVLQGSGAVTGEPAESFLEELDFEIADEDEE